VQISCTVRYSKSNIIIIIIMFIYFVKKTAVIDNIQRNGNNKKM